MSSTSSCGCSETSTKVMNAAERPGRNLADAVSPAGHNRTRVARILAAGISCRVTRCVSLESIDKGSHLNLRFTLSSKVCRIDEFPSCVTACSSIKSLTLSSAFPHKPRSVRTMLIRVERPTCYLRDHGYYFGGAEFARSQSRTSRQLLGCGPELSRPDSGGRVVEST
jgi:hypothetical protein